MSYTAYELYAMTLRELNQYQAPLFEPADFNHFFNSARQDFIEDEKKVMELTQQVTDNLRAIATDAVKEFGITGATSRTCSLPEKFAANDLWEVGKYHHLLGCIAGFVFTKDTGCKKKTEKTFEKATRLTNDMYGTIFSDYYTRPLVNDSVCRPYYQVRGNNIKIVFDTPAKPNNYVALSRLEISYVAQPNLVKLASRDVNDQRHINSDWPTDIDLKIVRRTAKAFFENNLSQRQQTYNVSNPT